MSRFWKLYCTFAVLAFLSKCVSLRLMMFEAEEQYRSLEFRSMQATLLLSGILVLSLFTLIIRAKIKKQYGWEAFILQLIVPCILGFFFFGVV
ncbi:hypothetical protein ACLVWU_08550 [Bdellovibrio sp. HCB290]|uniref:hypothetical protein n=1 Tax=Bdellovibrio sp. HCB290 TaxID=3394356 RepID=UPI0039B431A0